MVQKLLMRRAAMEFKRFWCRLQTPPCKQYYFHPSITISFKKNHETIIQSEIQINLSHQTSNTVDDITVIEFGDFIYYDDIHQLTIQFLCN